MKRNITLSMIVRNEEKYLRECLESVQGIIDKIVLVDTGSNDNTIGIASEFGAEIYHFEWCNDFAAARNFALKKSAGDWILYMDADERLSPGSREKLRSAAEKYAEGKFAIRCLVNSVDEKRGNPKLMKYTRFFRNSTEISFTGKVHEQIDDSLLKQNYTFIDSDIEIVHLGYNIEKTGINEKARRNLSLLLEEYAANPSPYYEYHLGLTYGILENKTKSAEFFARAIKSNSLSREYRTVCYINLAVFCSYEKMDFAEADDMIQKGLKLDPDNVMLNLVASEIYGKTGKTGKALELCVFAFKNNKKMEEDKLSSSIFGVYMNPRKIIYRGLFLALQMQDQKIFEFFLNEADADMKSVVLTMLNRKELNGVQSDWMRSEINDFSSDILLLLSEINSASVSVFNTLRQISEKYPEEPRYLMTLGSICFKKNDLKGAAEYYQKAMKAGGKDPSPVFYLISAYVAMNDLSPIPDLLEYADRQFGSIPVFKEKMEQLKQKLLGVL